MQTTRGRAQSVPPVDVLVAAVQRAVDVANGDTPFFGGDDADFFGADDEGFLGPSAADAMRQLPKADRDKFTEDIGLARPAFTGPTRNVPWKEAARHCKYPSGDALRKAANRAQPGDPLYLLVEHRGTGRACRWDVVEHVAKALDRKRTRKEARDEAENAQAARRASDLHRAKEQVARRKSAVHREKSATSTQRRRPARSDRRVHRVAVEI